MLEHLEMLDITVHDYQAAMDKLTRKSRSPAKQTAALNWAVM